MSGLPWWAWHGQGWYVWGAYGAFALAVCLEVWHLRAPGADDEEKRS